MAFKLPFKLTIKLEGKPDAIHDAVAYCNELCSQHGQFATLKATATIEGMHEGALLAIRDALEDYLREQKTKISGEVAYAAPLFRPGRAEPTPMDPFLELVNDPTNGIDAIEFRADDRVARIERDGVAADVERVDIR